MIDIGKILKRAWHILWNYKVLWIFGILLAVTVAGSGSGNYGTSYQFSRSDSQPPFEPQTYRPGPAWQDWEEFRTWVEQDIVPVFEHPDQFVSTLIWIGVALFLFVLVVSVIYAFVRYVSETAVMRMVDDYEQTGTKVGFKQGWKLGWSRRAFRLWVIDLIIHLPVIVFLAMLIGLGMLFFFSVVNGNTSMAVASSITAIGCAFIFIMALSLLMVFLKLLRQFFARSAVLEETGIGESFRRGWAMFKRNWKSGALMWLVMLGISIGYGIVSMIVFFLLFPVFAIMLIPAVLVAAIPGLIAFGIASLFTGTILAAIIGGIVAVPFLLIVVFLPLSLIHGWYLIYASSVWTLTYREMKTLESLEPPAPVEIPAETA